MPIELGRHLIAAGVVSSADVEAALFHSVLRGISFPRALIDRGAISERALNAELDLCGGLVVRHVVGAKDLFARLPRSLCRRFAALPTRRDPTTKTVDVAVADPLDPHIPAEFSFHLGATVRVVRAPLSAIEEAIRALELDEQGPVAAEPTRVRRATPAFPHGAPHSTASLMPSQEVPIPLVRRTTALLDDDEDQDEDVVLPLRQTKPLVRPHRDQHETTSQDEPSTLRGTGTPQPLLVASPSNHPTVSFPSSPPQVALLPEEDDLEDIEPAVSDPAPSTLPQGGLAVQQPPEELPLPLMRTKPEPSLAGERFQAERDSARPAPPGPSLPLADPEPIFHALVMAQGHDDVVRQALRGLRLLARRVAVFIVRRGAFKGHACNAHFGDETALREVTLPMDQPSILATAAATHIYLGPIPGTPVHASLLNVLENPSLDVAVAAITVRGRPVMMLVADQLGDTLMGTRRMGELAQACGDALLRILTQKPS